MKYQVAFDRGDGGVNASVPALPGCRSEGDAREETRTHSACDPAIPGRAEGTAWESRGPRTRGAVVAHIPGANHQNTVRSLEKTGSRIVRQDKHRSTASGGPVATLRPLRDPSPAPFAKRGVRVADPEAVGLLSFWPDAHTNAAARALDRWTSRQGALARRAVVSRMAKPWVCRSIQTIVPVAPV